MIKYAHLTLSHREVIENMSAMNATQTDIGLAIGVTQSTISRELGRLKSPEYSAKKSHAHAVKLAKIPTTIPLLDRCAHLVGHVANRLRKKYSIAQALILTTRTYPDLDTITPQAFYNWLYSSDTPIKKALRKLMVRPRSRKQPRKKTVTNKGKIVGMVSISERPAGANDRTEFGHWEGDLIIGKGGCSAAATMVERVSRLTVIIKVSSRKSDTVVAALARRMRSYHVKSITWDQGKELAAHVDLSQSLGVPVFFADAHSPWQRGSNENTNGVSRRHLPKGTSLDVHPSKLRSVQDLLNDRPMQVLSWASPKEAYAAQLAIMH